MSMFAFMRHIAIAAYSIQEVHGVVCKFVGVVCGPDMRRVRHEHRGLPCRQSLAARPVGP